MLFGYLLYQKTSAAEEDATSEAERGQSHRRHRGHDGSERFDGRNSSRSGYSVHRHEPATAAAAAAATARPRQLVSVDVGRR